MRCAGNGSSCRWGCALSKTEFTLTPELKAQIPGWRERWIENALSTRRTDDEERAICRQAVNVLYAAAGLSAPQHIVFVPSPFVLRFAGGLAAALWHLHHKDSRIMPGKNAPKGERKMAPREAVRAAMDPMVSETLTKVNDAVWNATADAIGEAIGEKVDAATWRKFDRVTDRAGVWNAMTWQETEEATRDSSADRLADVILDVIGIGGWEEMWHWVCEEVESATRFATEGARQAANGATGTPAEGWDRALLPFIRKTTTQGHWFRCLPLQQLSEQLGVGDFGLACTKKTQRLWQGGNFDAAQDAYLTFFRDLAKLDLDYSRYKPWEQLARHSGPRMVHADFCMISDRPERLLTDERGRPHCDDGPFCRWRDGTGLYAVHGVRVPWWIIEHPDQITCAVIEAERNVAVRRVMMERYGLSRYLLDSGAKAVHTDDWGTLYRKKLRDESLVMVKVTNATGDPLTGEFHDYFLRVPPRMRTAREAVAWTFGKEADEYAPKVET